MIHTALTSTIQPIIDITKMIRSKISTKNSGILNKDIPKDWLQKWCWTGVADQSDTNRDKLRCCIVAASFFFSFLLHPTF